MKYLAGILLLLLLGGCDMYIRVAGTVVDADNGKPVDAFTIYQLYNTNPGKTKGNGIFYTAKDSGRFELSKVTGGIKPELLMFKVEAKGYEPYLSEELRDGELTIKLKKSQ